MRVLMLILLIPCVKAQAAGGGSGGGGSGSSSDDGGNRCHASHCRQCEMHSSSTCKLCHDGFIKVHGSCRPCGRDCANCNLSGVGKCDVCKPGYVLFDGECAACADHCIICSEPGLCDTCNEGYFIEQQQCTPCSPHCKSCRSPEPSGCTACYWMYELAGMAADQQGCSLAWGQIITYFVSYAFLVSTAFLGLGAGLGWALFASAAAVAFLVIAQGMVWTAITEPSSEHFVQLVIFVGFAFVAAKIALKIHGESSVSPNRHEHYVSDGSQLPLMLETENEAGGDADEGSALVARAASPSGMWRGYYTQGNSDHGVAEFSLNFNSDGGSDGGGSSGGGASVSGEGVDAVGAYTIFGRASSDTGRIAFTKQYQSGSANVHGVVLSTSNRGHAVEYRGKAAAVTARGRVSLGSGLRGEWSLNAGGVDSGRWHLWPVMESWNDDDDGGDDDCDEDTGDGSDHDGGDNSNAGECCVCFDEVINARLEPCGHVALCTACANRLNPRVCPLCRVPIQTVRHVRSPRGKRRSGEARGLSDKKGT